MFVHRAFDRSPSHFLYMYFVYEKNAQNSYDCVHESDRIYNSYLEARSDVKALMIDVYDNDECYFIINCLCNKKYFDPKLGKIRLVLDMCMFDAAVLEGRRHLQKLVNDCHSCQELIDNEQNQKCSITDHIQKAIKSIRPYDIHCLFQNIYNFRRISIEGNNEINCLEYVNAYIMCDITRSSIVDAITQYLDKFNINLRDNKSIYDGNLNDLRIEHIRYGNINVDELSYYYDSEAMHCMCSDNNCRNHKIIRYNNNRG